MSERQIDGPPEWSTEDAVGSVGGGDLTSVDRYDRESLAPYQSTLISWVGPGGRVLEFGPSTGYMSSAMRSNGCHVTAVEVDHDALPLLKGRADVAHWGDLDDLESVAHLEGGCFEVVLLADVLEHLREPLAVLAACGRWMASDARVLVSMPNIAYWRIRKDLAQGRWRMTKTGILDETHLRFFTRDTAEEMFTAAGFSITRRDYVWWEHPFDERVRSAAPWLWPAKRRLNEAASARYPELFASQFLWELTPVR